LCGWAARSLSRRGTAAFQSIAVNVALFGVFAFHHSLFARDWVKSRIDRVVPKGLRRSVYVWTASLLLFAVLVLWQPIGADLYRATDAAALAMTAIQVAGLWLIAGAVATIDPLELAGIRPSAGTGSLQIRGPYRFVRHPLYLGWILAVFGAAHMTGDRLAFAVMSSAYLVAAIPLEERSLLRSFGDAYADYQRRVRWRVVPYVY
jgi:protein-S-isoprenylcysteine O-methyltransferase Ste14